MVRVCFEAINLQKVGCWLAALAEVAPWDSISVYVGPVPREREKEERKDSGRVKMSKQPPPIPTASAIGPCPAIRPNRTAQHWTFTKNNRTTDHPTFKRSRWFWYLLFYCDTTSGVAFSWLLSFLGCKGQCEPKTVFGLSLDFVRVLMSSYTKSYKTKERNIWANIFQRAQS